MIKFMCDIKSILLQNKNKNNAETIQHDLNKNFFNMMKVKYRMYLPT